MRRLTAFFGLMTCVMLGQVGLPRLVEALQGKAPLATALLFLAFPALLWTVYAVRVVPTMRWAEAQDAQRRENGETLEELKPGPWWTVLIGPALALGAIGGGWGRLDALHPPLWAQLAEVALLTGAGVLGLAIGRDDYRTRKPVEEQRAQRLG